MELFILLVLSLCCFKAGALEGQEVDCDDPKVFSAVDLALKTYNNRKDGNQFALVQILEARETEGPGTNLLVKYQLKETNCAVGQSNWQECDYSSEADSGRCEAHVHRNGLDSSVSQTCTISRAPDKVSASTVNCMGCWHPIPNDSDVLLPIVRYTIRDFNNQSKLPYFFDFGEITETQSQVVNGWNYKFVYSIKETNCSKEEFSELKPECKPVPGGSLGDCRVAAYVNVSSMLVSATQDCKFRDHFSLRCTNCKQEISTGNLDLLKAVDIAMEKYNNENSDTYYYKVKQIKAATSQVLAGINYGVDFTLVRTNCSKLIYSKLDKNCTATKPAKLLNCRGIIYVRPWESVTYPKVTCVKIVQIQTDSLTDNDHLTEPPPLQRYIAGLTPFRTARQAVYLPVFSPESENKARGGHSHSHRTGYRPGHIKHGYQKQKTRSSREDKINQEETLLVADTENPDQPSTIPREEDTYINPTEVPAGFSGLLLPDDTGESNDSPLFDSLPDLLEPPVATCPGKLWKPRIVLTTTADEMVLPTHRAFEDFDLSDALSVPN